MKSAFGIILKSIDLDHQLACAFCLDKTRKLLFRIKVPRWFGKLFNKSFW